MEPGWNSTRKYLDILGGDILSAKGDPVVKSAGTPGEILVTVATAPIWAPLFGIAKAVVTDSGGTMAHAVIVGREYGIPVVAATVEGTTKIKTGQRITVDGDNCCIYILANK